MLFLSLAYMFFEEINRVLICWFREKLHAYTTVHHKHKHMLTHTLSYLFAKCVCAIKDLFLWLCLEWLSEHAFCWPLFPLTASACLRMSETRSYSCREETSQHTKKTKTHKKRSEAMRDKQTMMNVCLHSWTKGVHAPAACDSSSLDVTVCHNHTDPHLG